MDEDLKTGIAYETYISFENDGSLRLHVKLPDRPRLIEVTEILRDQFKREYERDFAPKFSQGNI